MRHTVLYYTPEKFARYTIGATIFSFGYAYKITDRRMRWDLTNGDYKYFEIAYK